MLKYKDFFAKKLEILFFLTEKLEKWKFVEVWERASVKRENGSTLAPIINQGLIIELQSHKIKARAIYELLNTNEGSSRPYRSWRRKATSLYNEKKHRPGTSWRYDIMP